MRNRHRGPITSPRCGCCRRSTSRTCPRSTVSRSPGSVSRSLPPAGTTACSSGRRGRARPCWRRRLPGLLPPLDRDRALEATMIHSAAGVPLPPNGLLERPPFRAPHHTSSMVSVIGGGSAHPRPGDVSLAHCGVLFLDEIAEFPAAILDSLRQPLEEGVVRVGRAKVNVDLPAELPARRGDEPVSVWRWWRSRRLCVRRRCAPAVRASAVGPDHRSVRPAGGGHATRHRRTARHRTERVDGGRRGTGRRGPPDGARTSRCLEPGDPGSRPRRRGAARLRCRGRCFDANSKPTASADVATTGFAGWRARSPTCGAPVTESSPSATSRWRWSCAPVCAARSGRDGPPDGRRHRCIAALPPEAYLAALAGFRAHDAQATRVAARAPRPGGCVRGRRGRRPAASVHRLAARQGTRPRRARGDRHGAARDPARCWERCVDTGVAVVARSDPRYPPQLVDDPGAPHGAVRPWRPVARSTPVGSASSARATPRSEVARPPREFGYELASRDVAVVSGLAKGIDGAAHRGALAADRRGRSRSSATGPTCRTRNNTPRCGRRCASAGS